MHRFGQIIGERVEFALREPLASVAAKHSLYLDYKHPRETRGGRRKVIWHDSKGNGHDLDYVLEQGGSETVVGRPKVFIEIAYHASRNRRRSWRLEQTSQAARVAIYAVRSDGRAKIVDREEKRGLNQRSL